MTSFVAVEWRKCMLNEKGIGKVKER